MPESDANLAALAEAGFPIDMCTDEQLAVFAGLSAEEVRVIVDIKARLDAVEPEVQAHAAVAGAALF
jgi:hypothetical protein